MSESDNAKLWAMSGPLRLMVLLLIIFTIAISLIGCRTDYPSTDSGSEPVTIPTTDNIEGNKDEEEGIKEGEKILSPVRIPYIVENPLEFINIEEPVNINNHRTYFQIRGLVDQGVEDKINGQIKALYEDMLAYASGEKLPPYRGIMAIGLSAEGLKRSYLSITPDFSSNNLLSVAAHLSITYNNPDQTQTHISMIDSLNFNLKTGESFSLEEVFTDDVNGFDIVNDHIIAEVNRKNLTAEHEYYGYDQLTLVAPFRGVNKDQKFFLNEVGINIIIDNNNPEFHFGFSSAIVNIPYFTDGGYIAITERYFDYPDGNPLLYTNQQIGQNLTKRFLNDYQVDVVREFETYKKENIDWYVTYGHPKNLAAIFVEKMNQIRVKQENEVLLDHKTTPVSFVDQNIYIYRLGPYVNLTAHMYYQLNTETKWTEQKYVFNENGEIVELADLFVEGFDFTSLLKEHLIKTIKDYGNSSDLDIAMLLENVSFSINDTSISFSTIAITNKSEKIGDGIYPISFYITYKDIGVENLTIFD